MKTINILDFSHTIKKFISGYDLPAEVKRLALKEIYEEIATEAHNEALVQAQEREDKQNA